MEKVQKILSEIKGRKFKPIYFLMGEEAYYIDLISDYIEATVLSEQEKGFNQTILYGRDVKLDDVLGAAKRFPMMAEYQVILVKEAQDLSKEINATASKGMSKLEAYAANPQPTTILVFAYKYKKLAKNKKVYKAIAKNGLIYESAKIYEDKVGDWIRRAMQSRGYQIAPKAAHMLVEFLGNDLGKVNNELQKLQMILPQGTTITPEHVEVNIGISKDFNNFELLKALGQKDYTRVFRIANYFAQNPKNNPLVLTISQLHSFFYKILIYHGLPSKDKRSVASALRISPFFVSEYVTAAHNYPMKICSHAIALIREADVKGKGVGAYNQPDGDILKELLVRIMG